MEVGGQYWDGAASQLDQWNLGDVVGSGPNGTSTLMIQHAGSTGVASVQVPALQTNSLLGSITLGPGSTLSAGSGSLTANVLAAGTYGNQVIFNNPSNSYSGDGSGLGNLNAANLNLGTVAPARLGSGAASSYTFLRGDGTWAAPGATAVPWSSLTNPLTDLNLTMGLKNTSFNYSSAGSAGLSLNTVTPATSTASTSSPYLLLTGQYWTGSGSNTDSWSLQTWSATERMAPAPWPLVTVDRLWPEPCRYRLYRPPHLPANSEYHDRLGLVASAWQRVDYRESAIRRRSPGICGGCHHPNRDKYNLHDVSPGTLGDGLRSE